MLKTKTRVMFHQFISNHVNDFVELDSYLSNSKLYGVISKFDEFSVTLTITYLDEDNPSYNEVDSLFIPISSIKSIRKL